MKRFQAFIALSLVVALAFGIVPSVSAQGITDGWVSGITCQNLNSTDEAVITIEFYSQDGTMEATFNDSIPAGQNVVYLTSSVNFPVSLPANFLGSALVSSRVPVSCNVNTQTNTTGTRNNPLRVGTSAGFDKNAASPEIYVPQIMKTVPAADGSSWNSYFSVQNTTDKPVDVTIEYYNPTGAVITAATESVTIAAYSSQIFFQGEHPDLPAGLLGSAVVTADDGNSPLAVVVAIYNNNSSASKAQFLSYNGVTRGANVLYVPRFVRNFYNYQSGLTVQNIGDTPTTITITWTFANQSYVYNSAPIAPKSSLALYAPSISELAGVDNLPEGSRSGSVVVEAADGGLITAIVNEDNRGGKGVPVERAGQGSTYNAVAAGTETNIVFLPQVPRRVSNVWSGGFQISNTTNQTGSCNIEYGGAAAANETNVSLPASGSILRFAPNVGGLPDGFNGSVTVTCNRPITGIANLAVIPGSGKYGDSFSQSNGLNQ